MKTLKPTTYLRYSGWKIGTLNPNQNQEALLICSRQEALSPCAAEQELLCASPSSTVSLTRHGWSPTSGQGVSLLAACLPGVSMHPFHVTSPSLPALPGEVWGNLASKDHGSIPGDKSAAFLLSEPHFVQVWCAKSRAAPSVWSGNMPLLCCLTSPETLNPCYHVIDNSYTN
jgi:hypothetical protein